VEAGYMIITSPGINGWVGSIDNLHVSGR